MQANQDLPPPAFPPYILLPRIPPPGSANPAIASIVYMPVTILNTMPLPNPGVGLPHGPTFTPSASPHAASLPRAAAAALRDHGVVLGANTVAVNVVTGGLDLAAVEGGGNGSSCSSSGGGSGSAPQGLFAYLLFRPLLNVTGDEFLEHVSGKKDGAMTEVYELGGGKWQAGLVVKAGTSLAKKTLKDYGFARGKSAPVWVVLH